PGVSFPPNSSEAVTNSYPSALSSSMMPGTARTVVRWMSCSSTMLPGFTDFTTRRSTASLSRFRQSNGSTVHITWAMPISRASFTSCFDVDPYGGRIRSGVAPVARRIASCVRDSSDVIFFLDDLPRSACVKLWPASSWPSRCSRRTSSGCFSTFRPTRKNVALTSRAASTSSNSRVLSVGPSSNVSATHFTLVQSGGGFGLGASLPAAEAPSPVPGVSLPALGASLPAAGALFCAAVRGSSPSCGANVLNHPNIAATSTAADTRRSRLIAPCPPMMFPQNLSVYGCSAPFQADAPPCREPRTTHGRYRLSPQRPRNQVRGRTRRRDRHEVPGSIRYPQEPPEARVHGHEARPRGDRLRHRGADRVRPQPTRRGVLRRAGDVRHRHHGRRRGPRRRVDPPPRGLARGHRQGRPRPETARLRRPDRRLTGPHARLERPQPGPPHRPRHPRRSRSPLTPRHHSRPHRNLQLRPDARSRNSPPAVGISAWV